MVLIVQNAWIGKYYYITLTLCLFLLLCETRNTHVQIQIIVNCLTKNPYKAHKAKLIVSVFVILVKCLKYKLDL